MRVKNSLIGKIIPPEKEDLIIDTLFVYHNLLGLQSLFLLVKKRGELKPLFTLGPLDSEKVILEACEHLKEKDPPFVTEHVGPSGEKGNLFADRFDTPFFRFFLCAISKAPLENEGIFALRHLSRELQYLLRVPPGYQSLGVDIFLNISRLVRQFLSYPYQPDEVLQLLTKELCESLGFEWTLLKYRKGKNVKKALWPPLSSEKGMLSLRIEDSSPVDGLFQEKRGDQWIIRACHVSEESSVLIALGRATPLILENERNLILALPHFLHTVLQTIETSEKLRKVNLETILTLVRTIEARDIYTKGHSEGVAYYAVKIAEEMGFDQEKIEKLKNAALLHDIGKIGIPDVVLMKPRALTKAEWAIVKQHPQLGFLILKEMKLLSDISPWVKHHHERWDGKGYPDGLRGEEIPLEARILAVADALEAMVAERPYRKALTFREARKRLREGAGTQWDPEVVRAALRAIKKPYRVSNDRNKFYRQMERLRYEEAIAPMKLAVLYKIAEEVEKFSDLKKLLQHVLKTVSELRGKDDIYFIFIKEKDLLVARAYSGMQNIGDFSLPADSGIVGWVARTKLPALVNDTTKDKRYVPPPGKITRSEIAVPLISGNRLIGVFDIESPLKNAFSTSDLRFLKAISTYLAAVIELAMSYNDLKESVIHDFSTGAYSFKYLAERFNELTVANKKKLSIGFVDLNNFKYINDNYGHSAGDLILREFVKRLKLHLRSLDMVGRYGGDEFILMFPGTTRHGAEMALERLKKNLSEREIKLDIADLSIKIDFSYGVASYPDDGSSLRELIYHADQRMYRMKEKSRRASPVR